MRTVLVCRVVGWSRTLYASSGSPTQKQILTLSLTHSMSRDYPDDLGKFKRHLEKVLKILVDSLPVTQLINPISHCKHSLRSIPSTPPPPLSPWPIKAPFLSTEPDAGLMLWNLFSADEDHIKEDSSIFCLSPYSKSCLVNSQTGTNPSPHVLSGMHLSSFLSFSARRNPLRGATQTPEAKPQT